MCHATFLVRSEVDAAAFDNILAVRIVFINELRTTRTCYFFCDWSVMSVAIYFMLYRACEESVMPAAVYPRELPSRGAGISDKACKLLWLKGHCS